MNRYLLNFALIACLTLVAACSTDSDSYDHDRVIIDPPYVPMFEFGEDGIPYRAGYPQLSDEMQTLLKTELAGHVWTRLQTNEIVSTGDVASWEYYDKNKTRPAGFYVVSEDEVIWYVHTYDPNIPGQTREAPRFRVWSIYNLSGKWYLDAVEPLGERRGEDGTMHKVWGTSHYVREMDVDIYY